MLFSFSQLAKPEQELWVGEVANKNNGGGGYGHTFGSAIWYADSLGVKALYRHSVYCRCACVRVGVCGWACV